MNPFIEQFLKELVAWLTSTRMQVFVGGFLLLLFRNQLDLDEDTCTYIRNAVIAVVIGISLRDIVPPKPVQGAQ